MLRWYLLPTPNFFSDRLWPYCDVNQILHNFDPYPPRMDKSRPWTYNLPSVKWPTADFLVSTEINPFFFSTVPYFPHGYWMTPKCIPLSLSCTMFSTTSIKFRLKYLHYLVLTSVTLHITPEILPEMFAWGPLCITDLFQNKSVAYFNPK